MIALTIIGYWIVGSFALAGVFAVIRLAVIESRKFINNYKEDFTHE